MIGNDIIDLSVAKLESDWQRKGFLEKQFTEIEQQLILDSPSPFISVWKIWSMKEAAYKAYTQQNELRFFAPKKFNCLFMSKQKGLVMYKDQKFYTSSIINREFIFTLAGSNKSDQPYSEFITPRFIDCGIKTKLSEIKSLCVKEIKQKKAKNRAPAYYYKEILLTKSCSISHHGKFGVFSLIYA